MIVYGCPVPSPDNYAFEAERRGELVLGGSALTPDSPRWSCPACGTRFGSWGPDATRHGPPPAFTLPWP